MSQTNVAQVVSVGSPAVVCNNEDTKQYNLSPGSELRFEVEGPDSVICELKSGLAEMFGTELMKGYKYTFPAGAKVAIFTWQGGTIALTGTPEVVYEAKETPMNFYVNISGALEQACKKAQNENGKAPTVLIAGPTDVGKSTLARILLNYSVRRGRTPIYADMDVGQGSIGVPGTIGAVVVERPADIEEGFSLVAPIVFHMGHTSPGDNEALYLLLISRLAEVVKLKMNADSKVKYSGVVINTCGWVKGFGKESLLRIATEFEVEVILVLDQERLFNELVRDLPKFVTVGSLSKLIFKPEFLFINLNLISVLFSFLISQILFTPKSGGVVERSRQFRIEARDSRIREYFYGSGKMSFYPHSFDVHFSQLKIYKIGAPNLPDSCMPIGMKTEDNFTKLVLVQPSPSLVHHILAISTATSAEDNIEVIKSNLLGFICVTKVDKDRQTITVLSPQPRPLPQSSILLLSEVQFADSQ